MTSMNQAAMANAIDLTEDVAIVIVLQDSQSLLD